MDSHQLLELLQGLGMDMSGITPDSLASHLNERIVLKKFDGDQTDGTPAETIVIENGQLIEHSIGGNTCH